MEIIFQGGFDRNSVRSSDYNAEATTPTHAHFPCLQARHFDRSGPQPYRWPRSGEIRFYPYLPPSYNRIVTVARSQPHPDTEAAEKYISKR
jgi:hypothetical protein